MPIELSLESQLEKYLQRHVDGQSVVVLAFSGGLDSCVLLHFLQKIVSSEKLLAWHIHHGLLDCADKMASFCQKKAAEYQVNYKISHLDLDRTQSNLESIAREARYSEFDKGLKASDILLTAHHADDQAETLFLNLLRGSGSAGLRGIAGQRALTKIRVFRPLLEVSRKALHNYAKQYSIEWFEDPSNQSEHFDRNYLRLQILPKIKQRWPGLLKSVQRVCQIQSEVQQILDEVAQADLQVCSFEPLRLKKEALLELSSARQKNVIRYWIRINQFDGLPNGKLESLIAQLQSQQQANPLIRGKDYDIRIYDDQVFIVKPLEIADLQECYSFDDENELHIPLLGLRVCRKDIFQCLHIVDSHQQVQLGFRTESQPQASEKHRLKRLFQKHRTPPWMRDRTLLIFVDGVFKDILVL